jgi:hypothetical protein
MKRIVRLTENDLARIVRRVINEQSPTPATAAKKPTSIQIYYGDIVIQLIPEENFNYFLVRVKGSVKMPDGNFRALQPAVDASDKIDNLIRGFMSANGLQSNFRGRPTQSEKLMDVLKTKLTEMNNNIQTYLKSKPTQK